MARMVTLLLCIAAMAVVAHATGTDTPKAPKEVTLEIAGGPTIVDVMKDSASSITISKGEKRQFPGSCEVVCKDKCDVTVTTKCKKVPFEYELCEHKPITRVKKVCKDVCKAPAHGVTVYTTGASKGRRLFTTVDVNLDKKGDDGKGKDGDANAGKSTGYQVCEKVCKEEEVDDVKEECKTVQKEKEECKDIEDKKCAKVCKCVVQSPGSQGKSFSLDAVKIVQVNKSEKDGGPLFSATANIDKGKGH